MPDCGWPHRVRVSIHSEGKDLFECWAMPEDPSKHRYKERHPNLTDDSVMWYSEDVRYIYAPFIGAPFAVKIHRERDFNHIGHHVGYLIIIDGREMCFVHETSENTKQGLFHKVVEKTFIRRSNTEQFKEHQFKFQDPKQHEDCDRKDESGDPVVGTIEVRAFHLRKSIVIPPMTVEEYQARYNKVWDGKPVFPNDLPQIDEYSKRAVRNDREDVKNATRDFVKSNVKTWVSSGMHWPNFNVLFKDGDLEKFDDMRTRAAMTEHFASFKFKYR